LAHAFILIYEVRSHEIIRFSVNPKTAIRSLGERLAQLRLRGNFYLAKQLPYFKTRLIQINGLCRTGIMNKNIIPLVKIDKKGLKKVKV
jgi:hypothetical protein